MKETSRPSFVHDQADWRPVSYEAALCFQNEIDWLLDLEA